MTVLPHACCLLGTQLDHYSHPVQDFTGMPAHCAGFDGDSR